MALWGGGFSLSWKKGLDVAMGINVGNFKHVKHLTFHHVRRMRKVRIMTVGSLASTGVLTRLLGCSAARNEFGNSMRIGSKFFAMGKGSVGILSRHGPTSLP